MQTTNYGYDSSLAHLEGKGISFGTLGLLDAFGKRSNDSPNVKCNIFIMNIMTLVRNIISQKLPESKFFDNVNFELDQLRTHFEAYAGPKSHMIFYLHRGIYDMIPEYNRRKITPIRSDIVRYSDLVFNGECKPNQLTNLGAVGNVTFYGLLENRHFIFNTLHDVIKKSLLTTTTRVWMTSHCAIDYLLFETLPSMILVDSHTGRLCTRSDISSKVFKDDTIPFNRSTLKLFGDNEFVAPLIKQRPKALLKLGKIKLKTEIELKHLVKVKLGIDKELHWKL